MHTRRCHTHCFLQVKCHFQVFARLLTPVKRRQAGAEPDFTNYARLFDDPPFIDAIDFIFVSKNVEVLACKPLKHRDQVATASLPNEEEPSDHVLIAADLRVPSQ